MSKTATYRVTHTTIKHSGKNSLPGGLIELSETDAKTLLKGGFIEPWEPIEEPMTGAGLALVMSGTEPLPGTTVDREALIADSGTPLPDLPESAYPADAQPIPTEPEATPHAASGQKTHQVATRSSKGAKA